MALDDKYTVLITRPHEMLEKTETEYGQDVYFALVEAGHPSIAIDKARLELFKADLEDGLEPRDTKDYIVTAVFKGHVTPFLFGWQL